MNTKALNAALVHLRRVLSDPRLQPAQREVLRKAERELKRIRQSGKLDRDRLFRGTADIASVLLTLLDDSNPTSNATMSDTG